MFLFRLNALGGATNAELLINASEEKVTAVSVLPLNFDIFLSFVCFDTSPVACIFSVKEFISIS